jgi:hypothetical protein
MTVDKHDKKRTRIKRLSVFILTFFLYTGLMIVDNAGSEMTGHPTNLSLETGRVDREHYYMRMLGKEALINTGSIAKRFTEAKNFIAKISMSRSL